MKKNFGIIRISDKKSGGKIKSVSTLKSRLEHNLRGEKLAESGRLWHINKQKKNGIDVLIGSDSVDDVMTLAKRIYSELDIKPTSHKSKARDSVHAVEILCAFSSEMQDKINVVEWADDCVSFLQKKFGQRLISAVMHYDETTPHLHAIIIPVARDSKNRTKLNASYFFNNVRKKNENGTYTTTVNKLEKFQDEYYENVSKKHGLQRGDKVSSHVNDDDYVAPSHEQLQKFKRQTFANKILSRVTSNSEMNDLKNEIKNLKRSLNREKREKYREGRIDEAKTIEVELNVLKSDVAGWKNAYEKVYKKNNELENTVETLQAKNKTLSALIPASIQKKSQNNILRYN